MSRTVDDAVWQDEFLATCTIFERLLWIGLILTVADDQGRFLNNSLLIRAKLFPFDDREPQEITIAIRKFIDGKKLFSYTAEGKNLLQVIKWWNYQNKSAWMGASRYPAPTLWTDRIRFHGPGNAIITSNWAHPGGFNGYTTSVLGSGLPSELPSREGDGEVEGEVKGEGDGDAKEETNPVVVTKPVNSDPIQPGPAAPGPHPAPTTSALTQGQSQGLETLANTGYTNSDTAAARALYFSVAPDARECEELYRRVTDQITIPPDQKDTALQTLSIILSHFENDIQRAAETGKPVFSRWCSTRSTKTGKGYSRTNTNWLNWWLEEISPASQQVSAVAAVAIPKPHIICDIGKALRTKAEQARNSGFFQQALSEYQLHIQGCTQCGVASNTKDVLAALNNLTEKLTK